MSPFVMGAGWTNMALLLPRYRNKKKDNESADAANILMPGYSVLGISYGVSHNMMHTTILIHPFAMHNPALCCALAD